MQTEYIKIRGARQHNLKNIDLDLPKNKLIVFTGVSGSGKSSLAFDTLYAEGQRRYVESLSSYARQFLGIMDKPDVDSITGLSPSISIDQKSTSHNPRSTVGTITEIYDYLRLLFARIGHPKCPNCGNEIASLSTQQMVEMGLESIKKILNTYVKKSVFMMVLSPLVSDRKGEFQKLFSNLRIKGFTKIRIDGKIFDLNDDLVLIKTNKHTIEVVIDRLTIGKKVFKEKKALSDLTRRLTEDIEQAVTLSDGLVILSHIQDVVFSYPEKPKKFADFLYSEKLSCANCNISIAEIEPRLFSFNSPHGACTTCSGIGSLLKVDSELIINKKLSITEGGILPFSRLILTDTWFGRILINVSKKANIDMTKPLGVLTKDQLKIILYGTGNQVHEVNGENRYGRMVTIYETFAGVISELERRFSETESEWVRSEISKYLREEICPACMGRRLKKEALSITIFEKSIADITSLSVKECLNWVDSILFDLTDKEKSIASLIVRELQTRLTFLISVGLEYLTLSRKASTLAGGEGQRIRLASQIGSGLSGIIYVLDEPSIGLHARDNNKLISTLKRLRDLGNTVIVVEHDREMMENADYIIDIGPGPGVHGGKIVATGTVGQIKNNKASLTGKYISKDKIIEIEQLKSNPTKNSFLTIRGCRQNNLKNIEVSFPLGNLICITGVSGSGKSTLLVDTLYHALAAHFNPYHREKPGSFQRIDGLEYLNRVIIINQSPIGRTPRSNPATYTGIFTYIREIYASSSDSKALGFNMSRFSFNVKGGRCEACLGEGQTKIEMQFLPDVYVTCEVCSGSRYNRQTLEVHFKEKNIAEILQMTVEQAFNHFISFPAISAKLKTLIEVGLSYITLGQPAPTLSGGEAQRVKLATELSKKSTRNTLFILDEPTTGLHFADLEKLLLVLRQLVEMGNTVIVIEHNLDVVKNSDWIIDLGPEGGDNGGFLIAEGTPNDLTRNTKSYTGQFLRKVMGSRLK